MTPNVCHHHPIHNFQQHFSKNFDVWKKLFNFILSSGKRMEVARLTKIKPLKQAKKVCPIFPYLHAQLSHPSHLTIAAIPLYRYNNFKFIGNYPLNFSLIISCCKISTARLMGETEHWNRSNRYPKIIFGTCICFHIDIFIN